MQTHCQSYVQPTGCTNDSLHLQLEKCWQKYDVHTRQVKEEEEAQKAWDMEEREKRLRRREEFFLVLRKKDEGELIYSCSSW